MIDPDKVQWLYPEARIPGKQQTDQKKKPSAQFTSIPVRKTTPRHFEKPQIEHRNRDCKALCLFVCRVLATVPVFVAGTVFGTIHGIVCALVLSLEVACIHFTDCCEGSCKTCCITSPCQILACLIVTTMDIGIIMFCVPVSGFSFGGYNACLLLWNEKSVDEITIKHEGMSKLRLIDSSLNQYVIERFDDIVNRLEEKSSANI